MRQGSRGKQSVRMGSQPLPEWRSERFEEMSLPPRRLAEVIPEIWWEGLSAKSGAACDRIIEYYIFTTLVVFAPAGIAEAPDFWPNWRRERDSNPRNPFGFNGFQDRRHQPLGHPSAVGPDLIVPDTWRSLTTKSTKSRSTRRRGFFFVVFASFAIFVVKTCE